MIKDEEKIYAFIDSQNLNLSVKDDIPNKKTGKLKYQGWELDFKKFYVYLKDKFSVSKAFLFIGKMKGYKYESLYNYLERSGYSLIFKPTYDYFDENGVKHTKGNVDAELVLHTMINFSNFDNAIIVSGDGDYYCLIEFLVNQNKLKRIIIPNKYSYSSLLDEYRGYFAYVSDLKEKLEKKRIVK